MSENFGSDRRLDHQRIDVHREQDCRYWSDKLGVSPERLRRAVREVGPLVEDVRRHLGK
jgi:hypothetical protein